MDPDVFIDAALDAGRSNGIDALDADQRLVYLISQAEILSDMEGVDTFLGSYFPRWIEETAAAFADIGAAAIAAGFRAIAAGGTKDDPLLDRVNELITSRAGYDYESIRKVVERRLATRSA